MTSEVNVFNTGLCEVIQECRLELVKYLTYLLIIPSDNYLFLEMKRSSVFPVLTVMMMMIMMSVVPFLKVQDTDFYSERIHILHNYWTRCANVSRDRVKKQFCTRFSKIDSST